MKTDKNHPLWWEKLSPPARKYLGAALSLATGLLVAFMLHYVLYRVGLPGKPFIYVAF